MSGDLNRLARWDGQRWRSMDVGVNDVVTSLLVHQDTLYAAGDFSQEGFPFPDVRRLNRVAQWKNGGWYPLGNGIPHEVSKLTVSAGRLVALRPNPSEHVPFTQEATVASRWNGTEWQRLNLPFTGIKHLRDMLQFREQTVYVGEFLDETAAVSHVAVETGSQLMPKLEPRLANGLFTFVSPMVNYRGEMVVVGTHRHALFPKHSMATWNGRLWQLLRTSNSYNPGPSVLSPNPELSTLYVHNDTLYYARTHHLYAFDGTRWVQVGDGVIGQEFILSMAHHNNKLYIGGRFPDGLARLDGGVWTYPVPLRNVNALQSFGDDLIIGGEFSVRVDRNGMLNRITRLTPDGQYLPLGEGFNNNVQALAVYNGELYAAGDFTASGDKPLFKIARWDGQEWQPVGRGINGNVYSLSIVDDHLVAYGRGVQLSVVGSPDIRGAARWNGSEWLPLIEGWNSGIYSVLQHEGILYVSGGTFNVDVNLSRGLVGWDSRTNVSAPMASLPLAGEVSVYPQPASRTATLQFSVAAPGSSRIEVFDLLGRLRLTQSEDTAAPGTHSAVLDLGDLQPGMYVYRITSRDKVLTGTIIRSL